mgnify:CR=1 FL=1
MKYSRFIGFLALFGFIIIPIYGQTNWEATICRVKYSGGGDWYSDPSSLPNLIKFINNNTSLRLADFVARASLEDNEIFKYPYLYLTGHGNVLFNEKEIENLRKHLTSGGFLHVDDNYGLDNSFRREMKRVFPNKEWEELPFEHPIYSAFFQTLLHPSR